MAVSLLFFNFLQLNASNSLFNGQFLSASMESVFPMNEDLEETICAYSKDLIVKENRTIPIQLEDAACRVLVLNRPDFHYELIESVILKYPLPWGNLTKCDFSKTNKVIFNTALAKEPWMSGELDGYKDYYRTYLQGTKRRRLVDNVTAIIAELVSWEALDEDFAARIDVSCGQRRSKNHVNADPNRNFCLMHVSCAEPDCDETTKAQSCWLNPMHESCFFMADVFPMFPESLCDDDGSRVRLCVVGGAKRNDQLASALAFNKSFYEDKVAVQLLARSDKSIRTYRDHGVDHLVEARIEKDFLSYQRAMSKCHILLPLLYPGEDRGSGYFRFNKEVRKVSGSLSQTVGYSFATVMHEELHYSYKDVLKGSVATRRRRKELPRGAPYYD